MIRAEWKDNARRERAIQFVASFVSQCLPRLDFQPSSVVDSRFQALSQALRDLVDLDQIRLEILEEKPMPIEVPQSQVALRARLTALQRRYDDLEKQNAAVLIEQKDLRDCIAAGIEKAVAIEKAFTVGSGAVVAVDTHTHTLDSLRCWCVGAERWVSKEKPINFGDAQVQRLAALESRNKVLETENARARDENSRAENRRLELEEDLRRLRIRCSEVLSALAVGVTIARKAHEEGQQAHADWRISLQDHADGRISLQTRCELANWIEDNKRNVP